MKPFLTYIDTFLGKIFCRIKASTFVTTKELVYFRVLYGTLILLYFLPSWSYLKEVPPGFFEPKLLSFANLTNNFLPDFLYTSLDVLVVILILCIILGVYTRISLILMFVVSSVLFSYAFSLGKIDHYTSLFLFTYPVLAFTNLGTDLALIKDREISNSIQNKALGMMGILIAFGFFSGGFAKCLFWIDFDMNTSGFFDWFYGGYFNDNNTYLLAKHVFKLPIILFEIADHVISVFEIVGFIFLVKGKRHWITYLTIASVFHFSNLLLLNFSFSLNVLSYGIFIICPVLPIIFKANKKTFDRYYKPFVVLCIIIAIIRIYYIIGSLEFYYFHSYGDYYTIEYSIDFVLWVLTIISGFYILRKRLVT